jgi:ribonuclease Y
MIMNIVIIIAAVLISLAIGVLIGIVYRKKVAESKIQGAESEAKRLVDLAKIEAENLKKEEIFKAKEEIMNSRKDLDQEIKERRGEVQKQESRLIQKEENLEKREGNFEKREQELARELQEIEKQKEEIEQLHNEEMVQLQKIASLTKEEAKNQLLSEMDRELTAEKAALIREKEQSAKENAVKNAKEILSYAVQKCAADHSQETTVSIVALPNDDMKGRIIGREGRNIKALETLTGVDLIIDDTPEAVVLSGFDPLRREVAKIALEKLIDDGRIHPAKIEEMVEKAKEEVDATIKEEGERAVLETGVIGLHPDIVKLIGKLKYRTSYGQNVLNHSIEVSNLARIMAEELELDPKLARRAGLLHDIGKALDHDMEGTHVEIGVEVLKKYKENALVINAVEAHHGDVEPQTLEAVLVQAADAISASRPGARRETVEAYIKRLQNLEEIADSFEGVEKSFAIQAGREVRIIVKPDRISDDQMTILARDVAKKVESEMDYPGQIKVNVIRETRVVDYAK